MKSHQLFIFSLSLLLIQTLASAQQLNLRHIDQANGLPQTQVTSIVQDDKGFIWLGTFAGLCRFDGTEMRVYTVTDGLAANNINRLFYYDGTVIAVSPFGVSYFDGTSFTNITRDTSKLLAGRIFNASISADGTLYLATSSGLLTIRDFKVEKQEYENYQGEPFTAVAFHQSGNLWTAAEQTVIHIRNDIDNAYILDKSIPYVVNTILPIDVNSALVGTTAGLFIIRDGIVSRFSLEGVPDYTTIYCIIHDRRDGTYIMGTRDGLVRFTLQDVISVSDEKNGLQSKLIYDLFICKTGNLWIGTGKGAAVLFPSAFLHFTVNDGLGDSEIQAIFEDSSGRILIGGPDNSLTLYDGRSFTAHSFGKEFVGNSINDIEQDSAGEIYLTTSRGIYVLRGNDAVLLDDSQTCISSEIDSQGRLWVGCSGNIYQFVDGRLILAFPDEITESITPMSIREDKQGNIWFATRSRGVYRLRGDTLENFDENDGFTNRDVWSISVAPGGQVWFATGGDGVFQYDGSSFHQLTTSNGLSDNNVWHILADSDGYVWCGTNVGIDRYDGQQFILFTTDDGLSENEGMNDCSYEDSKGRKWFGTFSGLNLAKESFVIPDYQEPPIYLERLEVNGRPVPVPDETVRFESNERYIHVEAAIPSYRAEGSLRYLYKLEGLDTEWKVTNRLQPFSFSNLNPGNYVFRLKTSYKKQVSTNEASMGFVITRPYYQNPFFIGVVSLAILGLAFSWHRFRTGAIEKARLKLEEKVQRRTADLQSANRELEAFNLAVTNNLKVPVRHIIGFSDIARSREHAERRDHYLTRIHHNALNLNEMIGDLHDLALAGSILLNPSAINLSLETRIIAGKLKKDHPEYTAEVIVEDDIMAYCDDRLMRIVLKNLLSNAFKATMHLEEGVIQLYSRKKEDGQKVYTIKDNGIGLDETQKNLLFKPFTQIHNPDVFPGKGLGLVIVQRVINRHQGEVWVETAPGQGLTLQFTLPDDDI